MTALATPATNYRTTFMDDNATGRLSSFHWLSIKEIKKVTGINWELIAFKTNYLWSNDSLVCLGLSI